MRCSSPSRRCWAWRFPSGSFILLPTCLTGGCCIGLAWKTMPLWVRNRGGGRRSKVAIFLAYLYLCSRMKDIHRVFQYHGAEHKTIFCYENGAAADGGERPASSPGTIPAAAPASCSWSSWCPSCCPASCSAIWPIDQRRGCGCWLHLLLLPVVVGITYEFNRYVGRPRQAGLPSSCRRPGMWMQNFTTFEPDDSMIEVGIAALKLVLPEEKGEGPSGKWRL